MTTAEHRAQRPRPPLCVDSTDALLSSLLCAKVPVQVLERVRSDYGDVRCFVCIHCNEHLSHICYPLHIVPVCHDPTRWSCNPTDPCLVSANGVPPPRVIADDGRMSDMSSVCMDLNISFQCNHCNRCTFLYELPVTSELDNYEYIRALSVIQHHHQQQTRTAQPPGKHWHTMTDDRSTHVCVSTRYVVHDMISIPDHVFDVGVDAMMVDHDDSLKSVEEQSTCTRRRKRSRSQMAPL